MPDQSPSRKPYSPICECCHMRPKMDRCDCCEECWYSGRYARQRDGWQQAVDRAIAAGDVRLAESILQERERG